MTGHQAEGLSELHNWSPRDAAPRRGQSKCRRLSAVLCFGLRASSDLCCDSFFICSRKLVGKIYLFFFLFLRLLSFSLEITKWLPLARWERWEILISLAKVSKVKKKIPSLPAFMVWPSVESEKVVRKWCSAMYMFWIHVVVFFLTGNIRLNFILRQHDTDCFLLLLFSCLLRCLRGHANIISRLSFL